MGIFSADIFIPPNTIDFADVFGNLGARLADSPVVLVVIILLYVLSIIAAALAYKADRNDFQKVSFLVSCLGSLYLLRPDKPF